MNIFLNNSRFLNNLSVLKNLRSYKLHFKQIPLKIYWIQNYFFYFYLNFYEWIYQFESVQVL